MLWPAIEVGAPKRGNWVNSAAAVLQVNAGAVRLLGWYESRDAEALAPFLNERSRACEQVVFGPIEWVRSRWDHSQEIGRDKHAGHVLAVEPAAAASAFRARKSEFGSHHCTCAAVGALYANRIGNQSQDVLVAISGPINFEQNRK